MSASFVTRIRYRPHLPDDQPERSGAGLARQIALRPARLIFPDGEDHRDPPEGAQGAVTALRTYRGRIQAAPWDDEVAVVLAEIPSGRMAESSLDLAWFLPFQGLLQPGWPFELVVWKEFNGSEWEDKQQIRPILSPP